MEPEDLEFMYGVENDDRLWNVGVTNVPYSRSMLLDYITSATGDIFADKQVRLMIDNEVGETIGMVDLMDFSPIHRRAELGLVIRKEYRGRGYASAVLDKIADYGRKVIHLHQIYAIVPEHNEKCIKVLELSDFQKTTRLNAWLLMARSIVMRFFFKNSCKKVAEKFGGIEKM